MTEIWKTLAGNLERIINGMTVTEFVKQPRLIETADGTARTLMMKEFYERLIPVPGHIFLLGVRWGADFASLIRMRQLLEPANQLRAIVGFDTFEGHIGSQDEDGEVDIAQDGALSVSEGWENFIVDLGTLLLTDHPGGPPGSLIKGDIRTTLPTVLDESPAIQVAAVIIDLDLYDPTYQSLLALTPRMVEGTVLWFDEVSASNYPGEAQAMRRWVAETGVRLEWWRPYWAPHEILATVTYIPSG